MKPDDQNPPTLAAAPLPDRREFLRACVRYPVLSGLAVVGWVLLTRRDSPENTALCVKRRVCDGCRVFDTCERPQAKAARKQTA